MVALFLFPPFLKPTSFNRQAVKASPDSCQ